MSVPLAQAAKNACDIGSFCAAVVAWSGVINGILAAIASLLSIAWFAWRFYKEWRDHKKGPEPPE